MLKISITYCILNVQGLDFSDIQLVVMYRLPASLSQYYQVHIPGFLTLLCTVHVHCKHFFVIDP